MHLVDPRQVSATRVVVVGAGFGGLAAALLLRAAGCDVTVVERHSWVGGKARPVASTVGHIDAGPTVLTMRHVFDAIFHATGVALDDYAELVREPVLARHFWPDGSQLDLFDDRAASARAIAAFAGMSEARAFDRFAEEAASLFDLFDAPMMRDADPSLGALTKAALTKPRYLGTLSPLATLAGKLKATFSDPRLRQLFGRYATYVGGSPYDAPALLSLVWRAEEAGVWRVTGGMHALAAAMAKRLSDMGGTIRTGTGVEALEAKDGQVRRVVLASGQRLDVDLVVFNGDPRALAQGLLGADVAGVAAQTRTTPRSLSARVWSFAARPTGVDLSHHNVFFGADPAAEFADLKAGRMPRDPTVYVCAEDRGTAMPRPEGLERFELILNAAPLGPETTEMKETASCRQVTFQTLNRFGLTFDPAPGDDALATPRTFESLFPGSAGSLYGQSPHGMTAALKRPRARTAIRGLYLAGGGTHPGAGVPMAALSGQHAAEAITRDLVST